MATDFAIYYFQYPLLLGLVVLMISAYFVKPTKSEVGFLSLGAKRVLIGYLGLVVGILIFSFINAYTTGLQKVELGYIEKDTLLGRIPGWGLYIFILTAPFILLFFTVIGLPLLAILSHINALSIVAILFIAIFLSFVLSLLVSQLGGNNWCSLNPIKCFQREFYQISLSIILSFLGFALFAKLKFIKSVK